MRTYFLASRNLLCTALSMGYGHRMIGPEGWIRYFSRRDHSLFLKGQAPL